MLCLTSKNPLQHNSATISEAGACLTVCLTYQRFQPKCAYKLRAYKQNMYVAHGPVYPHRPHPTIFPLQHVISCLGHSSDSCHICQVF